MALSATRAFSRAFIKRLPAVSTVHHSRRHESEGAGPYRPVFNLYFWPKAAEYWKPYYPPTEEKDDEYEKEEIYLDQLEARMKKYDDKYSMPEQMKKLYNEYGWEEHDDRAFHIYGNSISEQQTELQYGRGKKIDPSHYINPEFIVVPRQAVPPMEYLSAEQVRRSRGSLSSFRETPPESPNIWKYWNIWPTVGFFGTVIIAKEYLVILGHDFFECLLTWGFWGLAGSIIADWMAWLHAIIYQEGQDKKYYMYKEKVDFMNSQLRKLSAKPNEVVLHSNLAEYRKILSERVLQKALSNRVTRILDSTLAKLQEKLSEEAIIKREAEKTWRRQALEKTMDYVESDRFKDEFTAEALRQFTTGDTAKISSSGTAASFQANLFLDKYQEYLKEATDTFIAEQTSAGTLNWVFRAQGERSSQQMSTEQKQEEYGRRISEWESQRNSVNTPIPSFG